MKKKQKGNLYDELHIRLYLKPDRNLTRIDLNAIDLSMEAMFKTLVQQFRKRGLHTKFNLELSK